MNLDKIKLKKKEISFSDLDVPYQNHFIKEFVLTGIALIIAIVFCILIKKYTYILGCLLIALGYAAYVYSIIYRSLTGDVLVLDLKCTDLERKENALLGKKEWGSKTCKITLSSDEGLNFVQQVGFASEYKVGDIVRIYTQQNAISQLNRNTYTVLNPIFMHILATK